jgi:hypothetical protein
VVQYSLLLASGVKRSHAADGVPSQLRLLLPHEVAELRL